MGNTFASAKQFVGVARETQQGTPVAMVATIPVDKFEPEDKPVWLDDKAIRGSMVEQYGREQGVIKSDFSMSGPVFGDTLGWLLANILGDNAYSGGTNAGSSTTTTAALTAGTSTVVALTSATGISVGTVLALDTAGLAENVTVASITGLNATITQPVAKSHASGATVQPVTAPFTSAFSTYNAAQGQPASHTFTHLQGPTATTGARQYPGCCLSELTLKFNAESQLFTYDAKGNCWPSVPAAAAPTSAPSTVTPTPSWRGMIGIGGPASGGTLVKNITDGEIAIKRALEPVYTAQNAQTPYIIQRGPVSVSGKLNFVAADESPYLAMIGNTQPQLQLVVGNGVSGAGQIAVQVDCQLAAYDAAKYNAGKAAVMYDVTFAGIANTTNAGASGGYSPTKVTLTNSVPAQTY